MGILKSLTKLVGPKLNTNEINLLYKNSPNFVHDILHLHYFKTELYYDARMNRSHFLDISTNLRIKLFMVDYASSFIQTNGKYSFDYHMNFLGLKKKIPFFILYNELIKYTFSSKDVDDMYSNLYKSLNPILIKLAEQFKDEDIELSIELFNFVKSKECNPNGDWKLLYNSDGNVNFTMLALNQYIWDRFLNENNVQNIFWKEKEELDKINEGNSVGDEYENYLQRVDLIINNKLK